MDGVLLNRLWISLEVIEARETLHKFKIADWPNMKKSSRQRLHRAIFKKANPQPAQTIDIREAIKKVNEG